MSTVKRYMNTANGWGQVSTAVKAHAAELEHLVVLCPKLDGLIDRALTLNNEQSALMARKQETTKELLEVVRAGNALVDLLRTGAREHFGGSNEKLVEFGVRPFRGRSRANRPDPTEPPNPQPAEVLSPASDPYAAK